jgi:hypothetical protein
MHFSRKLGIGIRRLNHTPVSQRDLAHPLPDAMMLASLYHLRLLQASTYGRIDCECSKEAAE